MKSGKWRMLRFGGGMKVPGAKIDHVRCEGELRLLEQGIGQAEEPGMKGG